MSKFCTNCGAALDDDKKFCTECGASVNGSPAGAAPTPPPQVPPQPQTAPVCAQAATAAMPPPQNAYQQATAYGGDMAPGKDSKYEPITTGGFIGITLLMCIPVIGFILMIVWACGGCRKINKRSFARATLIMAVIGLVVSLVLGFTLRSAIKKIAKEAGITFDGTSQSETAEGSGAEGDLSQLGDLLGLLEGITGEEQSGLDELLQNVEDINADASDANDGWPKSLRAYPGGTATAVETYRTEISGTTLDEMMGWIEDLKADGFEYQDFYDFGMTEQDMLDMNGWWATDGEIYLSVSYYEGVVTIDHTTELPDLESYFS